MNSYEERLERRKQRLLARATKASAEAAQHRRTSHELVRHIPMGQPLIVGHHSYRRHKRALDRSWDQLGKAVEADRKAQKLAARAERVGSAGISSDDPEGLEKLKEKLEGMELAHQRMLAANKVIRRHKLQPDRCVQELEAIGYSQKRAIELIQPDFLGRIGFPPYAIQNHNANMRRVKLRIAELEAKRKRAAEVEATLGATKIVHVHGDVKVVENFELNRLQVIFPAKPAKEVREKLRANGFVWARNEGAWQRQLGNAATYAMRGVLGDDACPNIGKPAAAQAQNEASGRAQSE